MGIDLNDLKVLSKIEFKTLKSIEILSKNRKIIPINLIEKISKIKNLSQIIQKLISHRLINTEKNNSIIGYSLIYKGYDFLAIN